MPPSFRVPILFPLIFALCFGQAPTPSPVPVPEPPAQAQKLLKFAAQLEVDAKHARAAGRQRALQSGAKVSPQVRASVPDADSERLMLSRSSSDNGIYVDTPKVYDDSLLEQMIATAQGQLASLQGFDQTGLTKAIGAITGANQQIASFGLSGGIQPPTQVTALGNVTSPFPPPSPNPPGPTTTLPSPQSPSASDILNEQLQLTSQIQNLRLLMEGSLSDQIMVGKDETYAKPRVTLGFPVVINPQPRYKNAVAMVEVFVDTNPVSDDNPNGEAPSILALLPREKTYNVAAISDKSAALGLGIATATTGASGGFLWGHKQYFIVKDQDTLALQFEPTPEEVDHLNSLQHQQPPINPRALRSFAWQFRPVLGQSFVQAGARQVFVQLAFPERGIPQVTRSFGTVHIRTYWRHVDTKTGILQWIVPGSLRDITPGSPILNYDMRQHGGAVAAFNAFTDMEDLGSGKMLIKLDGRLLPGTYLRVGANVIQPGTAAAGVTSDFKTTRFVASIADLASLKTFVISRDGTEWQLRIKPGKTSNQFYVDHSHVTVTGIDDSTALLSVPIKNFIVDSTDIPPVLVIGGKVYGYSDAPIDRKCDAKQGTCTLSVALPKTDLAGGTVISVKALMLDDSDAYQAKLAENRTFVLNPPSSQPEKLVVLTHDKDTATYLLYGHDLKGARIIWPTPTSSDPMCQGNDACLRPLDPARDDGTLRLLKVPLDFAQSAAAVVIERSAGNERPLVIDLPALSKDSDSSSTTSTSQDPKFQEAVVVGANDATLVGTSLDTIVSASFGSKPLTLGAQSATKLQLTGLAAAGVTAVPKREEITLTNNKKVKTTVVLQVVSSKIEVVPQQ